MQLSSNFGYITYLPSVRFTLACNTCHNTFHPNIMLVDTAYWILFTNVKSLLFSLSPFKSETFTTANIYFYIGIYQKNIQIVKLLQNK